MKRSFSLVLGVCLIFATAAQSQDIDASVQPSKWGASIDFEGKLGTERHIGEADAIVPIWQNDHTLLFGNARFRFDDNNSKEGNYGLALRHMHASGWNAGFYGYFDRRQTETENFFNQLTFGAEALGTDFDFRANTYWPIGEDTRLLDSASTATLSGTSVIFRGGEERALQGFDGEAGWRVPVFQFESPYDLRVYGGGFHFFADEVRDVTGPRLRAEFTAYNVPHLWQGARVTVGTEWQTDDVRGSQAFFSARLRIPLQSEPQRSRSLTAQERRMTAPIVRDIDIVAQSGAFGAPETVNQLADGQSFTVFNSDSTTGAALPAAIAGAGSNVLLSGTFNTTALVQVQNAQSVMAGSIPIRSPSGRTATLHTSATISGSDAVQNVIQLAGNNTLSGLTIIGTDTGGGLNAILVNNTADNVTIANNTIIATETGANTANGISAGLTNDNIVIRGNSVTVTGAAGQTAQGIVMTGNSSATISNNTLNVSGGTTNRAISLTNTTIGAGSTGNVLSAGVCNNGGGNTGSVSFTNGTTCP